MVVVRKRSARFHFPSLACALFSCSFLVPLNSLSATAAIEELVVTANRQPASAQALIGNTGVVDREALVLVAHTHISESLGRVAGAHMHRGNGQEYLVAIRAPVLTGAGACGATLTAGDGIPLRAAGFCNVNELFEANTEQAARLEVIRGPATALYGSNAMHGVVNVISPQVKASSPELRLDAGPYDYARLGLIASHQGSQQGFAVSALGTHDGGYRDDAGFAQQKLRLRHEYRGEQFTATTQLEFSNLNQETAGFIVGRDAYKDDDLAEQNLNPEAYRDARAWRLWTQLAYGDPQAPQFLLTPYLRYTEMEFLQHFLPGTPVEENGQKSIGVQTTWFLYPGEHWQVTAGVDAEYTVGFLKEFQEFATFLSFLPQGQHYDYKVDALLLAPYVQSEWQLGKRWRMTAGLRAETLRYDYDNRTLTGRSRDDGTPCVPACRFSRPADRDDHFNNVSPKLGVSYTLENNHRVYASFANGFRAPQATELYRLQNAQRVADLDSESLLSVELGIKGAEENWGYELLAYAMRKDNVIFRDSNRVNVDNGKTAHEGVEASLNWMLMPALNAQLNASYARHRYDKAQVLNGVNIDGRDVDTAPRRFGTLQLQWQPQSQLSLELEWLHMGRYYTDPENLHDYGGHNVLHLRGRWQVSEALSLYARLNNVTDRDYAERADFIKIQTTEIDRYFPGEPRALFLGVGLKL